MIIGLCQLEYRQTVRYCDRTYVRSTAETESQPNIQERALFYIYITLYITLLYYITVQYTTVQYSILYYITMQV